MYILCISDKNNQERRENAVSEFKKIGLDFEFFDAVMGKNMTQKELDEKVLIRNFLNPGEIGCVLSHLGCYKRLLDSRGKSLVIFEDDVIFTDGMRLSRLKKLVDFVESRRAPAVLVMQTCEYDYGVEKQVDESLAIHTAFGMHNTHGYILNRAAAETITRLQNPIAFQIDLFKFYYFLTGMELFSLNLDLSVQADRKVLPSTITADIADYGKFDKEKRKAFWKIFRGKSFGEQMGILGRRLKKHYLSNVKRKKFLKEISESGHS
mgnify:FL=1